MEDLLFLTKILMVEGLLQGSVAMVYEYALTTLGKEAIKKFLRLFHNFGRREANQIILKY